jgi:hypothetical protein
MKKILTAILITITIYFVPAQLKNINPDPQGEPWYVGGLRVPDKAELDKIPTVVLSQDYLHRNVNNLPVSLDNSTKPYFRPIFSQSDGSCSQSSGVAYNFTYEINRERGTSASDVNNRFPSHYTYNFLNGGSGDNGSWYTDGWDIIKANGCPTIPVYGGDLAAGGPERWMTGYSNYESGMNNRVKEYFAIDVSTPDGLETLKHWMYDHLENASDGSLVNFAAGIGNIGYDDDYVNGNYIITSWGIQANHAMTVVGWDDNITYDYNNDGQITNDVDINNDGIVDMRDWERGALLMVNSWGTSWGQQGKAYFMYKLLAEDMMHGGIVGKKVFAIKVKNSLEPQLIMRVKMNHNKRNMIKIKAGISDDINAVEPEFEMDFPLFNKQGGELSMRGNNSGPIEFSLDISPLLSYIDNNTQAKYFLIVNEDDPNGTGSGEVYDFAISDKNGNVTICNQHNVSLTDNDNTILSITATINFDKPQIITQSLPNAAANTVYSYTLQANGGTPEYEWAVLQHYDENPLTDNFPAITANPVSLTNDDDGYGSQTLDFDFPFFGKFYNELFILTDGSIKFEPGFNYIRTESAIENNKVISVFASDLMLFPADGDGIYYEGDATHATFRWKTSLYGDQSANIDVAVTLYPDGNIHFYYGNNITVGLDWASGISNGEDSAFILSNSGNSNPSNGQLQLQPVPYPTGMFISKDGVFQGITPDIDDTWHIDFKVTDNNNVSDIKNLEFSTLSANITKNDIFKLKCYPNPVTGFATFSYRLNQKENVNLSLFDLSGKRVKILFDKEQAEGVYQLIWYKDVPSGIYIYRLKTSNGETSGKLIVK